MEEVRERISLITDMNAAFQGNKKHIEKLEKKFQEISGNNLLLESLVAKPETGWKERLNRFKR